MEHQTLIQRWRGKADLIRAYSPDLARVLEAVAEELEQYEREHQAEKLTLGQASVESGYSTDHLRRLVGEGRIENVGNGGSLLLRRGDLPRKPPSRFAYPMGEPDLAGEVLEARIARYAKRTRRK
jgi:hypothetical protein